MNAEELGLDHEAFVFHAGPLIRMEKGYGVMNRRFRGRIFDRMMTFARHVDFRYHCLCVDKKYIDSSLQILSRLNCRPYLHGDIDRTEDFERRSYERIRASLFGGQKAFMHNVMRKIKRKELV